VVDLEVLAKDTTAHASSCPASDPRRLPSQYRAGRALLFVSRKHPPLLPELRDDPDLATLNWIIIPTRASSSSAEGQGLQLELIFMPDTRGCQDVSPGRPGRLRARTADFLPCCAGTPDLDTFRHHTGARHPSPTST
jgi:hypothetical protein